MSNAGAQLAEALIESARAICPYVPAPGVGSDYALRERYRWWSYAHGALQIVLLPILVVAAWWLIAIAAYAWAGIGAEAGGVVIRSAFDLAIAPPAMLAGAAGALLLSELAFRVVMLRSYAEYRDAVSALNAMDVQSVTRLLAIWTLVLALPLTVLAIDRYVVVGPRSIVSSGYFSLGSTTRPTTSVKALAWGSLSQDAELVVRFADDSEVWLFFGGMFRESERQAVATKLSAWTGKPLPPK